MLQTVPQSVDTWLRLSTGGGTAVLAATWACGRRRYSPYPAMQAYLVVNALCSGLVCLLLSAPRLAALPWARVAGCFAFPVAYVLSALLIFFTARQIFRDALAPLPGLRRLALVIFQWVAVLSLPVSFVTALVPVLLRSQPLTMTVLQLMRSVSVLEFCLVTFVLLAAKGLRIPWRSRIAGITLGLGAMAVVDTVCFVALLRGSQHLLAWVLARQVASLAAATLWLLWLAFPEPVRVVAGRHSEQLQRWNEIAVALGKPAPRVALTQPEPHPLFLQDVEALVDRVLQRNEMPPSR